MITTTTWTAIRTMQNTITDFFYLWPALVAGILLSCMMGPLGSIVLWRRMTFLGDALGHSSLLGLAVGAVYQINSVVCVLVTCILIMFFLPIFEKLKQTNDALLGVISHTFLAFGFVIVSLFNPAQNIESYLFGDILTITSVDLISVFCVAALGSVVLFFFWESWALASVHPELARAEKLATKKTEMIFNLFVAVVVAISIQFLGVLLISALLIIPSATARALAKTPEGMAILGAALGAVSVTVGIILSLMLDTPAAPTLVAVMGTQFILVNGGRFLLFKNH